MERTVAGGDDVSTGATHGVSGAGCTATSGKDLTIADGVEASPLELVMVLREMAGTDSSEKGISLMNPNTHTHTHTHNANSLIKRVSSRK